jgi:hypothetical protein
MKGCHPKMKNDGRVVHDPAIWRFRSSTYEYDRTFLMCKDQFIKMAIAVLLPSITISQVSTELGNPPQAPLQEPNFPFFRLTTTVVPGTNLLVQVPVQ